MGAAEKQRRRERRKNLESAIEEAWRREINPGGEVLACEVKPPPREDRNRLLSREEAENLETEPV